MTRQPTDLPLPDGRWPWLSLHDVVPETLQATEDMAARIEAVGRRASLLIIPGAGWSEFDIHRVQRLAGRGHELVAHGWRHGFDHWGGVWHRLHGAVMSNRAAEHLALTKVERRTVVRRSHDWFDAHGFDTPRLYTPPAWALGLNPEELQGLGFRFYEDLSGVVDMDVGRHRWLPLIGFEADRRWRASFLRWTNLLVSRYARHLRVAIHPYDAQGALADMLDATINREQRAEQ